MDTSCWTSLFPDIILFWISVWIRAHVFDILTDEFDKHDHYHAAVSHLVGGGGVSGGRGVGLIFIIYIYFLFVNGEQNAVLIMYFKRFDTKFVLIQ